MITIPLTQGHVALVDDDDAHLAKHKWHAAKRGALIYASRREFHDNGISSIVFLHQVIMGSKWIDHRNGDGLDCRRANMRYATPSQNQANRRKQANNSSGFKGVTKHGHGRWRAQTTHNGKKIHIGLFDTAEAAACAYDKEARSIWGEFAKTNF